MNEKENDVSVRLLGCLGLIALVAVTVIISTVINGWVLSVMWRWFISTTFGVAPLTITNAIGLSLLVSLLTNQRDKTKKKDTQEFSKEFIDVTSYTIIMPLTILAIGWVVHLFL